MHILVSNDDGPPSKQASPYFLPFIQLLEKQGHTVSVILPNKQRSWIGKAHIVGEGVETTPYWPPETTPETHDDSVSIRDDSKYPWILVNSTPAACVQIGISNFFADRPPIDLVISGPNFGRNTTAVFALSSGTLGAALEASACGYRSIAVSFAFFDRNHDAQITEECCGQAVRICEWLAKNASWGDSRLYSINVPVQKGVAQRRVVWTKMFQNQWTKGSCFEEVAVDGVGDHANGEDSESQGDRWRRRFKWAPNFKDIWASVEKAGPGYDGWAIREGETSVTPLHANFQKAEEYDGELDLSSGRQVKSNML